MYWQCFELISPETNILPKTLWVAALKAMQSSDYIYSHVLLEHTGTQLHKYHITIKDMKLKLHLTRKIIGMEN